MQNREKLKSFEGTKIMQKDQEENLVRHSLKEVQDQGVFYKRDNEKYTQQRDKLQEEKVKLLSQTSKIQCEIEYLMQMDKNLTTQLKLRNDDCESQLISHHYHKGGDYVPIYRKSEFSMKNSTDKRGGDLQDSDKSKQPFSIVESSDHS